MTTPDQLQREAADAIDRLAVALRVLRDRSPLSLRALARATHLSDSALSRYFTGQALPTKDAVEALSELCGGDLEALLRLWEDASTARLRVRRGPGSDEQPTEVVPAADEIASSQRSPAVPAQSRRARRLRAAGIAAAVLALIAVGAGGAQLWTVWNQQGALAAAPAPAPTGPVPSSPAASTAPPSVPPSVAASPPASPAAGKPHGKPAQPVAPTPSAKPQGGTQAGKPPAAAAVPADAPPVSTGRVLSIASLTSPNPDEPFVVDVDNFGKQPGVPMHLWSWRTNAGYNTQLWAQDRFAATGGRPPRFRFKDLWSGLCLTRGTQTDGGRLFQADCGTGLSQQWYLDSGGRLRSQADGRCLEVDGSLSEGATLRMWSCQAGRPQGWKFVDRDPQ